MSEIKLTIEYLAEAEKNLLALLEKLRAGDVRKEELLFGNVWAEKEVYKKTLRAILSIGKHTPEAYTIMRNYAYEAILAEDPETLAEIERNATPDLRPELLAFALKMEEVLKTNDHKGGWAGLDSGYLLSRLMEEVTKLRTAYLFLGNAEMKKEAIDVANFAMMIVDNIEKQG